MLKNKRLKEAIDSVGMVNNLDSQDFDKKSVGTAPISYADAVLRARKRKEACKKAYEDQVKVAKEALKKEVSNEEHPEPLAKIKSNKERKMTLDEGLFESFDDEHLGHGDDQKYGNKNESRGKEELTEDRERRHPLVTALKKEFGIDAKIVKDPSIYGDDYVYFEVDGEGYRIYISGEYRPANRRYGFRRMADVIEYVKEELGLVSDENYEALINALDTYLDDEIEAEIEYQREQDGFADDSAILGYAMEGVFSMLPYMTQKELVSNLNNIDYTDMIHLLEREDFERYMDRVRTIKNRLIESQSKKKSRVRKHAIKEDVNKVSYPEYEDNEDDVCPECGKEPCECKVEESYLKEASSHIIPVKNKRKIIIVEGEASIECILDTFINTTSNTLGGGTTYYRVIFRVISDSISPSFGITFFDKDNRQEDRQEEFYESVPKKFDSVNQFIDYLVDIYNSYPDTSAFYDIRNIAKDLGYKDVVNIEESLYPKYVSYQGKKMRVQGVRPDGKYALSEPKYSGLDVTNHPEYLVDVSKEEVEPLEESKVKGNPNLKKMYSSESLFEDTEDITELVRKDKEAYKELKKYRKGSKAYKDAYAVWSDLHAQVTKKMYGGNVSYTVNEGLEEAEEDVNKINSAVEKLIFNDINAQLETLRPSYGYRGYYDRLKSYTSWTNDRDYWYLEDNFDYHRKYGSAKQNLILHYSGYRSVEKERLKAIAQAIKNIGGKYIATRYGNIYFYLDLAKYIERDRQAKQQAEERRKEKLMSIDIEKYRPSDDLIAKAKQYYMTNSTRFVKKIDNIDTYLTYYYLATLLNWSDLYDVVRNKAHSLDTYEYSDVEDAINLKVKPEKIDRGNSGFVSNFRDVVKFCIDNQIQWKATSRRATPLEYEKDMHNGAIYTIAYDFEVDGNVLPVAVHTDEGGGRPYGYMVDGAEVSGARQAAALIIRWIKNVTNMEDGESIHTEMKEGVEEKKVYRVTYKHSPQIFSSVMVKAANEDEAKQKVAAKKPGKDIVGVSVMSDDEVKDMTNRGMSLMEAKVIDDFSSYEPWDAAVSTFDNIQNAGKMDALEQLIDEMYPDGVDRSELNDLLAFESEWVYSMLNMSSEEEDGPAVDFDEEE